jgi:hypothetical protein
MENGGSGMGNGRVMNWVQRSSIFFDLTPDRQKRHVSLHAGAQKVKFLDFQRIPYICSSMMLCILQKALYNTLIQTKVVVSVVGERKKSLISSLQNTSFQHHHP